MELKKAEKSKKKREKSNPDEESEPEEVMIDVYDNQYEDNQSDLEIDKFGVGFEEEEGKEEEDAADLFAAIFEGDD